MTVKYDRYYPQAIPRNRNNILPEVKKMNDKKGNLKKLAVVVLVLLLAVSAYVAAHPEETKDSWDEMEKMHGDNYEEHHREIHGEDWKEHVESCHAGEDLEGMHRSSGMMGTSSMLV
ncbi:MAG: hypothetical protein V3R82_04740 [Candidatus Hydrothermarchaeales archaeon]